MGRIGFQARLGVLNVIIGEIPHQTAGKRGKPLQLRTFIILQNLPDHLAGMVYRMGFHSGRFALRVIDQPNSAGLAGDLQRGGIAQKGIPAPGALILGALQKIAVTGGRPQGTHDLHGGESVGKQLPA